MTTVAQVITKAMHLFGITDQEEAPTATDMTNNMAVLNDMLRSEHMDAAAQYLIARTTATVPAGVSGSTYTFLVGTGQIVPVDAVGIRSIWCQDISPSVNRETRQASLGDVMRTTYPGIITKWHQERQVDGSILVTAWQPPNNATSIIVEYGGRMPELVASTDVVQLPPEGIHDITLMLGRRIMGTYGRNANDVGMILTDSEVVDRKWRDMAKGQQWLRFVRS